jgi:hypothetical protein
VAKWAFVLTDVDGNRLGELTAAKSRKLVSRLSSPSEASFTINGRHEEAADIVELRTDLVVYRDGVKVFRGRVGPSQDQASADRHTVTVTALDYRAVLNERIIYAPLSYTAQDQSAIGWALITDTQGLVGGDLGITRGVGQTTGVLRDRNYEAGKSVGELVTQLSEVAGGFEWDITPDLAFDVHYPQRGRDTKEVLDYRGSVAGFSRSINPERYANAVRVSGDETTTAVVREAADLGTRPEGRFDAQHGFPDVNQAATLAQKADYLLATQSILEPSYTVTLKRGRWDGPQALWLGDSALLVVRTGRLDETSTRRIVEATVDVGDSGEETVVFALGEPSARTRYVQRQVAQRRRLTELERR